MNSVTATLVLIILAGLAVAGLLLYDSVADRADRRLDRENKDNDFEG